MSSILSVGSSAVKENVIFENLSNTNITMDQNEQANSVHIDLFGLVVSKEANLRLVSLSPPTLPYPCVLSWSQSTVIDRQSRYGPHRGDVRPVQRSLGPCVWRRSRTYQETLLH